MIISFPWSFPSQLSHTACVPATIVWRFQCMRAGRSSFLGSITSPVPRLLYQLLSRLLSLWTFLNFCASITWSGRGSFSAQHRKICRINCDQTGTIFPILSLFCIELFANSILFTPVETDGRAYRSPIGLTAFHLHLHKRRVSLPFF